LPRLDSWAELSARRLPTPAAEEGYWKAHRDLLAGDRIRALREVRGLTQAQLARSAGTTESVVARIEEGCLGSDLDTLDRIAVALDTQLVIGFRQRDPR
jgi:ribosome-binding protein aMBF1 (putative translation factor)